MTRWPLRTLLLCLVAAVTVACSAPAPERVFIRATSPEVVTPVHTPAVGIDGTRLTLGGKPWWPIGVNAYQLGTDWSVNAGCGAQVDLDTFFGQLPPHSLTRFNAFSSLATNKETGLLDFSALDAVVRAAERHGQLLIAVLSSNEGSCEGDTFKEYRWYTEGWRTDLTPGMTMTFSQWLDTAVQRWGDSPALAGWTAVGEPEPSDCADSACTWQLRQCHADSAQVLRAFYDVTGARIHELDPGTPVFSGHAGGGQCGSAGAEFEHVSASPGIDVLEYHFYEATDSLTGDHFDGLPRRVDQARALDKPLLITEIGMEAGSCGSVDDREQVLRHAFTEMRRQGAAGAMFWSFVPDPRHGECTLDIGPGDPLMRLVGREV
ncbi:beta-mannosidase [Mycobacterium sp. NPDC003323]